MRGLPARSQRLRTGENQRTWRFSACVGDNARQVIRHATHLRCLGVRSWSSSSRDRRVWRRGVLLFRVGTLAREPFLHFVLLGAVIFGLSHYLDECARFTRITITQDQVRSLADNYRLQYGGFPTPQQLQALVDNFIKEEILYRQALKLGLDVNDEIIRRRLVQKYEFLEKDLATPAEPTASQLREYYRQHPDRYLRPATVTFTHVYFSLDGRGDRGARDAAQTLASNLNRRGATRAADQGDRFPGTADFSAVSREELGRVFGREGLAEAIFGVELNHWSAPLRSGFGWHTVYVTSRQPAKEAPFEEVRETLRVDYLEGQRDRRNTEAFAKLREGFQVVREGAGG
jgi:peptidyl-prolyl cis-trans isomerase C